jgi:hypothetical protein
MTLFTWRAGKEAAMTSSGARAQTNPLPSSLAARGASRITLAAGAVMLTLGVLLLSWRRHTGQAPSCH